MDQSQMNGHASLLNEIDEEFEFMGDIPREDSVIVERRRVRNNEITKRLGSYLLKGYCMLSDACSECDCILLRTPDRQLLCVGCAEVDVENKPNQEIEKKESKSEEETTQDSRVTSAAACAQTKKDRVKSSKKGKKKSSPSASDCNDSVQDKTSYSSQLENKLKWAVDDLTKSQSPNRINAMCTVIIKLTESIKALKEYEQINQ